MTVRISIDKPLMVSTLLITPNLKTEILLFTSGIVKTNSLHFLQKEQFICVLTQEYISIHLDEIVCSLTWSKLLLEICRNNNYQDNNEIKGNSAMFTYAICLLLYPKCPILAIQNPKRQYNLKHCILPLLYCDYKITWLMTFFSTSLLSYCTFTFGLTSAQYS